MSTTAPMNERTVTAVLLALWKRPETTMQGLLRETLAPLPDLREALERLRRRGCVTECTPAGGGGGGVTVRLLATGLGCWRDVLEEFVRARGMRAGRRVMVFLRTGSTNDVAWQCAASAENDGLLVVADEQTAGRGRFGHAWTARAEQSILCSLLLRNMPADSVDRLTLLAGLAVARAMEAALDKMGIPIRFEIKWPNDILWKGRKIAGILVERRGENVVIGVGVNVAQSAGDFAADLAARATSIYLAAGVLVDRLRIVTELLKQMEMYVATPVALDAAPESWMGEWKSRCAMLGTRVAARSDGRAISGVVVDVDPLRGLVISDDGAGGGGGGGRGDSFQRRRARWRCRKNAIAELMVMGDLLRDSAIETRRPSPLATWARFIPR